MANFSSKEVRSLSRLPCKEKAITKTIKFPTKHPSGIPPEWFVFLLKKMGPKLEIKSRGAFICQCMKKKIYEGPIFMGRPIQLRCLVPKKKY